MPFRRVPKEVKAEALKKCLKLENIKEAAEEFDISESTLRRDYQKVLDNVEESISKGPIDVLKKKLQKLWSRLVDRFLEKKSTNLKKD